MVKAVEDSRVILPFLPTLSHLATVKVALPLLNNFNVSTLDKAFLDIRNGNSPDSNQDDGTHLGINRKRAKKNLLMVPTLLRKHVLNAVHGMSMELAAWKQNHSFVLRVKKGELSFRWSSIGKIDTDKTVLQVVADENINVKSRFELACRYFLIESILDLWPKLKASDKTYFSETDGDFIVRFWAKWLSGGSQVPWKEAVTKYLNTPRLSYENPFVRFSAFFPFLRPESRQRFLTPLQWNDLDELRSCLWIMTRPEQEQILAKSAISVFNIYLCWPLQNVFLETAGRIFDFIDAHTYSIVLNKILTMNLAKEDYDYIELFRDFWSISPNNLKERASIIRRFTKLGSIVNEIIGKENYNEDQSDRSKRRKVS